MLEATISFIRNFFLPLLSLNKVFIKISVKYIDYTNIFSFDIVRKLLENTAINNYYIDVFQKKKFSTKIYDQQEKKANWFVDLCKYVIKNRVYETPE